MTISKLPSSFPSYPLQISCLLPVSPLKCFCISSVFPNTSIGFPQHSQGFSLYSDCIFPNAIGSPVVFLLGPLSLLYTITVSLCPLFFRSLILPTYFLSIFTLSYLATVFLLYSL